MTNILSFIPIFLLPHSPLFDLLQSRIWTCAGGVSGLPTSISRLFEQSLQQQLSAFIRTQLPLAVLSGLDGFGDLVDSLRLYLTRPSTQIVERFMERVCVPFTWRVLQTVDDPVRRGKKKEFRPLIFLPFVSVVCVVPPAVEDLN